MNWANGRGTTIEIAIHPTDSGLDSFHWRVSLARMVEDAPFSTLQEVDRTLVVMDGHGVDLAVGSGRPCRLGPASDPFGFPGDVPAFGHLVSGPVSILNVMTRREQGEPRVERLRVDGIAELAVAGLTIIHAVRALTLDDLALVRGDTVIVSGAPTRVRLDGDEAEAIIIRLGAR